MKLRIGVSIMEPPSLFSFATSELSQDAFVCWLLHWAAPECRTLNQPLHQAGTALLDKLVEFGKQQRPADYQSVEIQPQHEKIDVLVVVNNEIAIIIEDKTETTDHSGQLQRYKETIRKEFPHLKVAAIYLKTGDQSNYKRIEQ